MKNSSSLKDQSESRALKESDNDVVKLIDISAGDDEEYNETLLSKDEILMILKTIRDKAKDQISDVKKTFRAKRRMNYNNEDKYKEYNKRLFLSIEAILIKVSTAMLTQFNVNQEQFDMSIEERRDDNISAAINGLATQDLSKGAPKNQTPAIQEEIFDFHQRIYAEVLNNSVNAEVLFFL